MNKLYGALYPIFWLLMRIFLPWRAVGRERIPEGGALLCANHTSMRDPLYVLCAVTKKLQLHVMAKAELMKIPLLGAIMKGAGMIGVKRGMADVAAIKDSLRVLRNGEKLLMFPEGTRVKPGQTVVPHTGAAMLAARANVPLVPVYVASKKRPFRRALVVFGEPYYLEAQDRRLTPEESQRAVNDLMERIKILGENA